MSVAAVCWLTLSRMRLNIRRSATVISLVEPCRSFDSCTSRFCGCNMSCRFCRQKSFINDLICIILCTWAGKVRAGASNEKNVKFQASNSLTSCLGSIAVLTVTWLHERQAVFNNWGRQCHGGLAMVVQHGVCLSKFYLAFSTATYSIVSRLKQRSVEDVRANTRFRNVIGTSCFSSKKLLAWISLKENGYKNCN